MFDQYEGVKIGRMERVGLKKKLNRKIWERERERDAVAARGKL